MEVMRPANKRRITIHVCRDFHYSQMEGTARKKLRKLPHVFSKVLELPFASDADVIVEERPDLFRFVAEVKVDGKAGHVKAHAVEIHPGVIKIVVRDDHKRKGGGDVDLFLDKLEVDKWRFRLPSSARPELAKAAFVAGELIVTVPRGGCGRVDGGEIWGAGSRLVLVQ
ncbi:uncharacterized protein LOC105171332 [Sesamum indicum]|uniref:Uncharacterized protein LOC105171332 n=1 Tax=Sesamum indicum TaxID=4182 RepID=A0A6I9TZW9_SESIN|nr:uncharacterized protein LOC105171332 [Sesamum indicum]